MNLHPNGRGVFRRDSVLTREQHTAVVDGIKFAGRKIPNARMYLPIETQGDLITTLEWDDGTDMSDADWGFTYAGGGDDIVDVARSSKPMVWLKKGFTLPFEKFGPQTLRRNSENATIQVKELENIMITTRLIGSAAEATPTVPGMVSEAGTADVTDYNFSNASSAIAGVQAMVTIMQSNNIFGDKWAAFNTAQHGEIMSGYDAVTGTKAWETISGILGGDGSKNNEAASKIFLNPDLTDGSGMIWTRNPLWGEYHISRDPFERSIEYIDGYKFKIAMIGRVLIYVNDMIAVLSNI